MKPRDELKKWMQEIEEYYEFDSSLTPRRWIDTALRCYIDSGEDGSISPKGGTNPYTNSAVYSIHRKFVKWISAFSQEEREEIISLIKEAAGNCDYYLPNSFNPPE